MLRNYSRRKFISMSTVLLSVPTLTWSVTTKSVRNTPLIGSDLEKIQNLLQQKKAVKWLFTGDSITAGVEHTHGYRSYPEIFGEHIRWELKRPRDVVINTAISGNIAQNIIEDFEWRIGQFTPSMVSLMIGTNDCARKEISSELFKRKLIDLISRIRKIDVIPILHTPNPIITSYAPERERLPEFVKVIQKVALDNEIILVDNFQWWQEKMKQDSATEVFRNWLNDPLHPNGLGHMQIARLLFKKISIFNSADPTCGGKYYEGRH